MRYKSSDSKTKGFIFQLEWLNRVYEELEKEEPLLSEKEIISVRLFEPLT